MANGGAA